MIQVDFTVQNGLVTGFSVSGHSGYAEEGSDIVCAAVSSATLMAANTVTDVMGLNCSVTVEEGQMRLALSKNEAVQAQVILNGLLLHIDNLRENYADFIDLKISEV